MSFFELQWWVYLSLVASFFGICMGLNYLVKKFNEAKIDERLIRMLQKASTTQSTQVNGPLIAVETSGAARLNSLKTVEQPSPPGISLVFDREENKRRSDPYKLIKPRLSLEAVNIISPSARTVKSVPLKRIGSAHVAAKINSSLISTERVFIKNNEYGRQTAKESSSTAKSDCYVTQLITVQENKFLTRKDSNTSKPVSDGRVSESSTFIHAQDDTDIESVAKTEFDGIQVEETTPDEQNDSVTEKVVCKNIHDARIVCSKTSIVEITANKSTGLCDTKSNEEINTGCFIKRSVESIISKIANLKNKNENQKIAQNASDILIAAQQSNHSESRRNVTEIFSFEKVESRCSATKQPSSPSEIINAGKNFPVKNNVSEHTKETSSDYKSDCVEKIFPGKTTDSQHTAAKETTSSHSHSDRTGESFPVIKFEFLKHIASKENTSSHSHSDRTGEIFPVKTTDLKHIAAKETTSSLSDSDRAGEIFPVKITDSKHIAARETTSSHCDHLGEKFPVKRSESEHITGKETLQYAAIEPPASGLLLSVKKSVTMIESRRVNSEKTFCPSTKSMIRTNYKAIEYFPIRKKDSARIVAKETVSDTRSYPIVTQIGLNEENATGQVAAITPFYIQSGITIRKHGSTKKRESGSSAAKETPNTNIKTQDDDNVAKSSTVKMSEAARNAVKTKYLKELVLEKNKEDVESDNLAKKIEDSTVIQTHCEPDTSKPSDDSGEEPSKSLTDKIKELLEDEDTVDIKLYKPSSSAKE